MKWNKHFVAKSLPKFMEDNGLSSEVLEMQNPTPLGVFLLFITAKLLEDIVSQSNLYATQGGKQFSPLEFDELLRFLAINLLMGIKHLPSYGDYWSMDPNLHDEYIAQQMSVKRFTWILPHLHINDNSLHPKKVTKVTNYIK
ncbi:PiggyBac transposable element-derived protein 2, partial [Stegodyphus mimosarum]